MLSKMQLHAVSLLATADAVRDCRARLAQLLREGHPGLLPRREVHLILSNGLDVAGALESLGALLAEAEQPADDPLGRAQGPHACLFARRNQRA